MLILNKDFCIECTLHTVQYIQYLDVLKNNDLIRYLDGWCASKESLFHFQEIYIHEKNLISFTCTCTSSNKEMGV